MKNMKLNLKKMISLRGVSLILAGSVLASALSGCSTNKIECEESKRHVHMYVNDDGLVKYLESESVIVDGYNKSYNYREISDDESSLYEFMKKKGLLRIDENIDLILEQQELNQPFTIYEYKFTTFSRAGSSTRYIWTNDPEHENLTGKEKEAHYIYQAYNIVKDENGKYMLVPSPLVEDISEVMGEYPYIKENYYAVVDKYNVDVDYQDDLKDKKVEIKSTSKEDKTLKKTN